MNHSIAESSRRSHPLALKPWLWVGLALIAFFWVASWSRWGVLGEYSFLPLWVGYVLTMDGLVALRGGDSLLATRPRHLLGLFLVSAPFWWIFEGLNHLTQNWHYLIPAHYTALQIILLATLNFSIVVPAVFETTMFLRTFAVFRRLEFPRLRFPCWGKAFANAPANGGAAVDANALPLLGKRWLYALQFVGCAMFFVVVLLPNVAFGLIWVWLFFVLDAQNGLMGRPSLFVQLSRGDWRMLAAIAYATLICGFFWEMWNFYAFPKWYYTVPIVNYWHIFEMPLIGFSGYIPFALELYALYHFICGVLHFEPLNLGH